MSPATALVFLAAAALYLSGAYPWLAPRDAGDLGVAASTLGVAHAPGYPLHALLGRAIEALLPFGHPAWRLSVLSALAGAGAAAVAFAAARRRAGVWGGLAAAAAFALSAPLWKFSLLQEKYALHALFCAALAACAEGERETVFGRARLSGLLVGLGLVNHQSLLFWLPAPLLLWKAQAERHGVPLRALAAAALPWTAAGLSLTLYTWVRGEPGTFLDTVLRRRYGTTSLFAGFQRPLADAAPGLLRHFFSGLAVPAAALALYGAARAERARLAALLAGAAGAAAFLLLTRFDASGWAARSALEPAFLAPALVVALLAGEAVASLPRPAGPLAVALLAGVAVWRPVPSHRGDFLAYDYARDLRRAVPPGGALLASGDTASFALSYDALSRPLGFEVGASRLVDGRAWLMTRRARGPVFTTGMGLEELAGLGLEPKALAPAGLVQAVGGTPPPPVLVLRRERPWETSDSYSKDVLLSYAFASYLSARLLEARGVDPGPGLDLLAVLLDPEDYRWE
ncbi:MAG: DUF2723 domain-containing protein [Elusimicrobiota bacterium]|nr:DUF2723 domain-containing protein [Elusimicrobiota bacterium]